MTSHPVDLLVRYVSAELDDRERAAVEQHLHACPTCARDVEVIAQMHDRLSALPHAVPDRSFDERLIARLAVRPRHRWQAPIVLAAAAAALVIATAAATSWVVRRTAVVVPAQAGSVAPARSTPAPGQRAYMLLFFEDLRWRQELPAGRRRARALAFSDWFRDLDRQGRLLVGGRVLPMEGGRIVETGARITRHDGVLPEEEMLTGYILVSAADYDEATRLALGCPIVTDGKGRVVIRQVGP